MTKIIAQWMNVPDLTNWPNGPMSQSIEVGFLTIDHIIGKHVGKHSEPWHEWLSAELLVKLRSSIPAGAGTQALADASVELAGRFAAILEQAAQIACARPLGIVYESPRGTNGRWTVHWQLVLPHGAVMMVRFRRTGGVLSTVYYPAAAVWERNPARRWSRVVANLVVRYGKLRVGKGLFPPDPAAVRIGGEKPRRSIRFVSPANWGFSQNLDGSPYRGQLGMWIDAPRPAEMKHRNRRRLKRRFQLDEIEEYRYV